jgi:hypothetical protein
VSKTDTSFGRYGQLLSFGINGVDFSFTDDRNSEFPKTSLLRKWEDDGQNPLHPSSVQDKSDNRFLRSVIFQMSVFIPLVIQQKEPWLRREYID